MVHAAGKLGRKHQACVAAALSGEEGSSRRDLLRTALTAVRFAPHTARGGLAAAGGAGAGRVDWSAAAQGARVTRAGLRRAALASQATALVPAAAASAADEATDVASSRMSYSRFLVRRPRRSAGPAVASPGFLWPP